MLSFFLHAFFFWHAFLPGEGIGRRAPQSGAPLADLFRFGRAFKKVVLC
jgi:hypothetical protein